MPYSMDALINSNATIFSTSMSSRAKASLPQAESVKALARLQDLVREITRTHRELAQQAEAQSPSSATLLAVAKIIPGADRASWEHLRTLAPLHGWCALEIDEAEACVCPSALADALPQGMHGDPLTQALLTVPLVQQVEREALRATRGQSPLSVAIFGLEGCASQGMTAASTHLIRAIQSHCQCCDSLGTLETGRFALILPGAGLFKAQALVEDIMNHAKAEAQAERDTGYMSQALDQALQQQPLSLAVGIAGNTGQACRGHVLLEQAATALRQAKETGTSLVVYRAPAHPLADRRTLVQSHEKRFLFSGGE